jgi:hypothetical protein
MDTNGFKDNTNLQEKESVTINDIDNTNFKEIKYMTSVLKIQMTNITSQDCDNIQFCSTIKKRLLDFCKLIPCWSNDSNFQVWKLN